MPFPHAEGHALHDYGSMCALKGDAENARQRLEAALMVFRRLGAMKDLERTERALAELAGEHAS